MKTRVLKKINHAIRDFKMFSRTERIAVALSGGKDSVTLLWALRELNFRPEAFHVKLGIDRFTGKSLAFAQYICDEFNVPLHVISGFDHAGFHIDDTVQNYPGQQCGICGTLKRQIFNRFALTNQFDVLTVGHNMDDEAQMLLGNNLRWDFDYLKKSLPVLEARPGFVKRAKPLCYLREAEIKEFTLSMDFDVLHCQCPHSGKGSRKKYRKILDAADTIHTDFVETYYKNFLSVYKTGNLNFIPAGDREKDIELHPCRDCGELTPATLCRLCAVKNNVWRK